jgi:flagellar basal-body rod modification protein FlgD
MDVLGAITGGSAGTSAATGTTGASDSTLSEMGGMDFLNLLLSQISTQDPFEPVGNEELLNQISMIRDIEMNTSMTEAMKSLTGQQQFGAASSLIGQHVSGTSAADGAEISGVVTGVRFTADGEIVLQLGNGSELPLEQINEIRASTEAAERMIGLTVEGIDQRDADSPVARNGVVTGVRQDETSQLVLELDTGEDLRLVDVVNAYAAEG